MDRKERIAARAQEHVDAGRFAGIEWRVDQQDGTYCEGRAGMSDPLNGVPMPQVPIYRIYSMTKPIVSAMAMMLFDEGRLRLSDPVSTFIPAFERMDVLEPSGVLRPATTPMLVEHLMTHRAGLSYGFIPACPVAAAYRQLRFGHGSLEQFADQLAALPIAFEPGSAFRYSHATDILARVVEVACGERLDKVLKRRIFEPLGLEDTGFMVKPSERDRVMAMFGDPKFDQVTMPANGSQTLTPADVSMGYPVDNPDYVWGGHGLYSTVADYMKVAKFLTSGGAGSQMLLSPAGTRALWRNRIPQSQLPLSIGADVLAGYGWGLAGRVMLDAGRSWGYTSNGEFGWAGAASTYFWVDPQRDLTGVVMTQYLGASVKLADDMRNAVYQSLEA